MNDGPIPEIARVNGMYASDASCCSATPRVALTSARKREIDRVQFDNAATKRILDQGGDGMAKLTERLRLWLAIQSVRPTMELPDVAGKGC